MNQNDKIIYESIVNGMREGVFTLNKIGRITSMNAAAKQILNCDDSVIGRTFAAVFFNEYENDDFCEAILSAVYQNSITHNVVVPYRSAEGQKQLFMSTSYLTNDNETIGISAVVNDITELSELRDAVKAMETIRTLNGELEKRNAFIKKTFGRYLSDNIVSTILETENGLEIGGKKQDVTIMFTDIRGFTALSEQMKPHCLIDMLNHYLGRMIDIILSHKGTILEFIGDAIVAVFGAPLESDTRNYDAVACAVDMQCDMVNVNAYNESQGYPPIEMGIGIHSGIVVLGNIGSDKKAKYDVIGKHVNLASRIETYTVGGQILISDTVKSALGDALTVGKTLDILPKGVKKAIRIYEVRAIANHIMPDNRQHFTELNPPLGIECFPLDGKHTSSEGFAAKIMALSEKQFVLRTSEEIPINATISFSVCGKEIYAKAIGTKDGCPLLHITSGNSQTIREAAHQ